MYIYVLYVYVFLVTDTPDRMIAPPVITVVLAIIVLLLSGGIVATIVFLLFKRKKATVNQDSLQFTLTSQTLTSRQFAIHSNISVDGLVSTAPTNNGPTNIKEKKVKVV